MDKATAAQRYKEAVWAGTLEFYQSGVFEEWNGGQIKPLLKAFQEAGGTDEEVLELWRELDSRELEPGLTLGAWDKFTPRGKAKSGNTIDELWRRPEEDPNYFSQSYWGEKCICKSCCEGCCEFSDGSRRRVHLRRVRPMYDFSEDGINWLRQDRMKLDIGTRGIAESDLWRKIIEKRRRISRPKTFRRF